MNLKNLCDKLSLTPVNLDENREVSGVYCCDLLSVVMGKAPTDYVWVTVMANINAVAVASLTELGAIVFADAVKPDETVIAKAKENNINILLSEDNIFDTALKVHEALQND